MSNKLTAGLMDLLNRLSKILYGSNLDKETTSELKRSCEFINSALSDSNTTYPTVMEHAITFFALSKAADTPNRLEDIAQFFNNSVKTSTKIVSQKWLHQGAFVVELELAAGRLRIDFTTLRSFNDATVSLSINLTKP
jgi:hypothetical protein